jgi:hypothetical protein
MLRLFGIDRWIRGLVVSFGQGGQGKGLGHFDGCREMTIVEQTWKQKEL